MKYLRQMGIILIIAFFGEVISKFLNLPVPSNVIGMVILLILLLTGIIKLEMIEDLSDFLLSYLPFFFIPAGVGLISNLDLLKANWIAIFLICTVSTIITMVVTGWTIQFVKRRMKL